MTDGSIAEGRHVAGRRPPDRGSAGRRQTAHGDPSPSTTTRSGFDDLYAEEWSGLVALGWSLTGSWAAAEELAQDACTAAYRRWDEVGHLDRPGAWVRRAVLNRSASYHRDRASEERGLARWTARADGDPGRSAVDETGERAADRVGDPQFWAAVRSLPERQAACIALHYLDDRSVASIAEILGCRPATVKVHLHRGRAALAARLAVPPADQPITPRLPDDPDAREEER